jgi:thiol-disulfide isomerase/thioredoxin
MKNKVIIFSFTIFGLFHFNSQTILNLKNFPINTSPNATITVYNFVSGEVKNYWNEIPDEKFIIPVDDNDFTNIVIYGKDGQSKSFYVRKNDSITFDYQTKEIISSKFGYKKDDFNLMTIKNSKDWKKNIDNWSVSQDFIELIDLQSNISGMKFNDIPSNFPKGNPAYRNKLYQYLQENYVIKSKKTKNNNIYNDYLDYFIKIYHDPIVKKENLSQLVFTSLNAMASATTKEDFIKAFDLYKNNTTDENSVNYIENEYFLDDKIIDKKEIGLINFKKEQVKLKDILAANAGKYTVIDFWASWCGPCLVSLPKSKELEMKYEKTVSFIFMSLDKSFSPWEKAAKKFNINDENSFLTVKGTSKNLEIDGIKITEIPRYFIYDKKGKLLNSNLEDIEKVDDFLWKEIEKSSK